MPSQGPQDRAQDWKRRWKLVLASCDQRQESVFQLLGGLQLQGIENNGGERCSQDRSQEGIFKEKENKLPKTGSGTLTREIQVL